MNPLAHSRDPDIRGIWPAILRAARDARKLAKATGTPLLVMKDGKIVNALAKPSKPRKERQTKKA